ncbi:MAG: glycosyltransferase family 39 protein [Candidatus Omnitrophota bacterium]
MDKSRRNRILLIGLTTLFFILLNVMTLHVGHDWGDDFAQYIMYARNLLSGRHLTDGVLLGADYLFLYPPGYSFLLAPILWFRGLDFMAFKFLNILLWMGTAWGCYRLFLHLDKKPVWVVPLMLAVSAQFFFYKQTVSPDFLLTCLSVWAIYSFEKYISSRRRVYFYSFVLMAFGAVFTRSAGLFLYAAAAYYLIVVRRSWRDVFWLAVSLVLGTGLQYFLVGIGLGAWRGLQGNIFVTLGQIIQHLPILFKSMVLCLVPWETGLVTGLYVWLFRVFDHASVFFLAVVCFVFVRRAWQKRMTFLDTAFFSYFMMLVIWEGVSGNPPDIFIRYVIPVYPLILFYLYQWLNKRSGVLMRVFFMVVFVLNAWTIVCNYNSYIDDIATPPARAVFSWVKANTAPEDHLMFASPRAMALMTQRAVAPISFGDDRQNLATISRYQIRYIIVLRKDLDESLGGMIRLGVKLHPVWEDSVFMVFEVMDAGVSKAR